MPDIKHQGQLFVLAIAFASHVGLSAVLTGRMPAAALTAALALAALIASVLVTRHPLRALRTAPRRSSMLAAAGGVVAVFGAPALTAGIRMSDAPAGSVVVFWMSAGWALVAGVAAAIGLARSGRRLSAAWALVGAFIAATGVAGIVADWERPSSFSPLVRFAPREALIVLAGALFLAGGLMIVRAARAGGMDAARMWSSVAAFAASLVWISSAGVTRGLSSLSEQGVAVALAAASWALVTLLWPRALRDHGLAVSAATLVPASALMTALILVEQAVGVAGPQPIVVRGVVAGAALVLCGVVALVTAAQRLEPSAAPVAARVLMVIPLVLASASLVLPSILARVEVQGAVGSFSGSWLMSGAESIAGWAAVALGALLVLIGISCDVVWPAFTGIAAALAWPSLLGVPTHVLQGSLAPEIQQYYGTEYGSIVFSAVSNLPMLVAVVAAGAGMLVLLGLRALRTSRHGGVPSFDDGGS